MRELLTQRLNDYIIENNPDIWIHLHEETRKKYLREAVGAIDSLLEALLVQDHPPLIIGEVCMEELTRPLRPSRYHYIQSIVAEKFPAPYAAFERCGILVIELSHLVAICGPIFEVFCFSEETEDDSYLEQSITIAIKAYFKQSEREIVRTWDTTLASG